MEVGKETSRRVSADRRQGSQQRGHTAKRLPLLRGTYRFYIEARYQIFKLQSASSSFLQHSSWHNARPEPFPTATADSRPAHTMTPPPIRIVRLAHMRYRFADIETQHTFLADFGIRFLEEKGGKRYYAGEGPDPYVFVAEAGDKSEFLGGTFLVETREDLERASQLIPGASAVLPEEGPAGGFIVTFNDPDGLPCNLVWGLGAKRVPEDGNLPVVNYPVVKPRLGEFRRFKQGPSPVFKLGHFGLLVSDFEQTYSFYTKYFNLKATDLLTAPNGMVVAAFMHVDREEEWVDHHTFFFSMNSKKVGPHHCSFEVHDPDVQAIGHDWLKQKGYTPAWGVGRHILGSQVFDYWFMPENFMIEHYADGDQVNCHTETSTLPASDEALAIWGPAVPEGFMDAEPPLHDPKVAPEIQTVA